MDSCFRGNDVIVLCGMRCLVGLDGISVEFPRAREVWIPAFAGMTDEGVDSRLCAGSLCGDGGVFLWHWGKWVDKVPRARELWIPAFAGMTDDGVDSRLRGNDG